MSDWLTQIPHDLQVGLEGNRIGIWRKTFQKWAKHHGLELEGEWFRSLGNAVVQVAQAAPQCHVRRSLAPNTDLVEATRCSVA
ncbi:hypothetical protein [uncultured Tateyamaria sp.]|uniref:hypothetical protein n=1 Tax=uncultured Tateyamaria sp. TaxID=455651 RepID=UPI0026077512|nr:hypothetical protein [uncultured Tateyamaria sp.]